MGEIGWVRICGVILMGYIVGIIYIYLWGILGYNRLDC